MSENGTEIDWRAINHDNWDDRVAIHMASSFYDVESFRRGGVSTLRPFEVSEVGDVRGKRLVHLQCHIGLDTLSWARRGALVSGLDFSSPAVGAASSLAASLGIDASFVVSDIYDATAKLGEHKFDIVYTGGGALVWLPDIRRWAREVASLLTPGGFLYLVEGHPLAQVLDEQSGSIIAHDYFHSSPQVEDFSHTYTDGPKLTRTKMVRFRHTLGDILTALAEVGLYIDFVHEYDFDIWQRFQALERSPDGLYRFPAGRARVPLLFSVRAFSRG